MLLLDICMMSNLSQRLGYSAGPDVASFRPLLLKEQVITHLRFLIMALTETCVEHKLFCSYLFIQTSQPAAWWVFFFTGGRSWGHRENLMPFPDLHNGRLGSRPRAIPIALSCKHWLLGYSLFTVAVKGDAASKLWLGCCHAGWRCSQNSETVGFS